MTAFEFLHWSMFVVMYFMGFFLFMKTGGEKTANMPELRDSMLAACTRAAICVAICVFWPMALALHMVFVEEKKL